MVLGMFWALQKGSKFHAMDGFGTPETRQVNCDGFQRGQSWVQASHVVGS